MIMLRKDKKKTLASAPNVFLIIDPTIMLLFRISFRLHLFLPFQVSPLLNFKSLKNSALLIFK